MKYHIILGELSLKTKLQYQKLQLNVLMANYNHYISKEYYDLKIYNKTKRLLNEFHEKVRNEAKINAPSLRSVVV